MITVTAEDGYGPTLLARLDDAERETASGGAGIEDLPAEGATRDEAGGARELGLGTVGPVGTGTPGTETTDDALPGQ